MRLLNKNCSTSAVRLRHTQRELLIKQTVFINIYLKYLGSLGRWFSPTSNTAIRSNSSFLLTLITGGAGNLAGHGRDCNLSLYFACVAFQSSLREIVTTECPYCNHVRRQENRWWWQHFWPYRYWCWQQKWTVSVLAGPIFFEPWQGQKTFSDPGTLPGKNHFKRRHCEKQIASEHYWRGDAGEGWCIQTSLTLL